MPGECYGGRDVGEVRQTLWEVAEHLPRFRVVLFGEEVEIVGRGERTVEDGPGLFGTSLMGQALGQPEGARQERAFLRVFVTVAFEKAMVVQVLADGIRGADHALVAVVEEVHTGEQQERRIEILTSKALGKDAPLFVVALALDRLPDLPAHLLPASLGGLPQRDGVLYRGSPST